MLTGEAGTALLFNLTFTAIIEATYHPMKNPKQIFILLALLRQNMSRVGGAYLRGIPSFEES